ncbi:hypothetical protein CFN78_21870 [Amycolatopsis antarctica]|uniref:Uncharacterized protein n=1 Tax=Amycolatopsis antarctica TaxID=1854586 RepID=A0A263D196_9PSEU|nr:hypothetical protein [Amycolatopsis antarctica]OZM71115.1 hypothetical protein CFN78_21870 [Amycolatopsis antarctica]
MPAHHHLRTAVLAATVTAATASLSGCGLFGSSWDVRMEVQGPGQATVSSRFAGDDGSVAPPSAMERLPWQRTANVGFGFNDLDVTGAAPGTVCRIIVDGETYHEQNVDGEGNASCRANLQND